MTEAQELHTIIAAAEQAAVAQDFVAAERHLRDAAALQEAQLGPAHPDLANTLNNLGIVCERIGKTGDAERCYRRAHAIAAAALAPDDPLVATSLQNLRDFCSARGLPVEPPPPPPPQPPVAAPAPPLLDVELQAPPPSTKTVAVGAELPPTPVQAPRASERTDAARQNQARPKRTAAPRTENKAPARVEMNVPPRPQEARAPVSQQALPVPASSRGWIPAAVIIGIVGLVLLLAFAPWSSDSTTSPAESPSAVAGNTTGEPPAASAPEPATVPSTPNASAPPAAAPSAPEPSPVAPGAPTTAPGAPSTTAPAPRAPSPGAPSSASPPALSPGAFGRQTRQPVPDASGLSVVEAQVCRALSNWSCQPLADPTPPGMVFFYTRVKSSRDVRVEHRWYHEGRLLRTASLRIGANPGAGYRTYSRNTVPAGRSGEWSVVLTTESGERLHEERFTIR